MPKPYPTAAADAEVSVARYGGMEDAPSKLAQSVV